MLKTDACVHTCCKSELPLVASQKTLNFAQNVGKGIRGSSPYSSNLSDGHAPPACAEESKRSQSQASAVFYLYFYTKAIRGGFAKIRGTQYRPQNRRIPVLAIRTQ